jgi:DNA-binding transcriptional MerR regulator
VTKGRVPTVDIEIPDRPLFKAAEVCSIAKVQPYVLKSWESEFPSLGASTNSGARVYRRADIELVLEIRRLLFDEGLTLGAARRQLMSTARPDAGETVGELVEPEVRERLLEFKQGLQSILDLLSGDHARRHGT